MTYLYSVAYRADFWMTIAHDGRVSTQLPAAIGGHRTLDLVPTDIHVDTAGVQGWHQIHYGGAVDPATGRVRVVAGLSYLFSPAYGAQMGIRVDDLGYVTPDLPESIRGGLRSMTFLPRVLEVESTSSTQWLLAYGPQGPRHTGTGSALFLPGMNYLFQSGSQQVGIAVSRDCAITPSTVTLNGATYGLRCRPLVVDTDEDGVLDDADNCTLVSNRDQVDLDADTLGDACDHDRDGDGIDDVADVCPSIADPGQPDFDGDGIGDACDADADGDAVSDDDDNCTGVANTSQGDSDLDGAGDACDGDDDDDGVPDDRDVCPLLPDPAQTDLDGDGQGDACDGDDDADGVGDDVDLCPGTPLDLYITDAGCSADQTVALECPAGRFAKHGHYVSCVVHVANDLRTRGLIDDVERARIVAAAAKKPR